MQTNFYADGQVGSNYNRSTPRLNLTDGGWHHVVVSTLPSGPKVQLLQLHERADE